MVLVDELDEFSANVVLITDLDNYSGETIADRLDNCVKAHPILIIDRSWCIYSVEYVFASAHTIHLSHSHPYPVSLSHSPVPRTLLPNASASMSTASKSTPTPKANSFTNSSNKKYSAKPHRSFSSAANSLVVTKTCSNSF